ncbi:MULTISPECIES: DUF2767 family protein [Pantoea]|mgnify:FL=1|jgi:hypothetical protein|uniref:DUF2767 family protein n=1 Tax=Pantoea TaxID=53335 RepID=UPI0003979487|nr:MULTISPECIES: DUF2767 family protein [Pantoea]MBK4770544.1 DUF2767 family protein [Pantoea sp. Morm]ERH67185.1 hypothetical protein N172_02210 [Pantoea dispersa EGD-AAK13]KAA6103738.1 DUF2767 family protein [Pantoea sp. B_9]KAA6107744.1 DUF2767 family protein [Pantoea sp. B_10]KAA8670678.1 DUF2767 family protein [Pantoea dispersa]
MKRDILNEDDYDEVCRVIGDAVIVLSECGHETRREEIARLLQRTRHDRAHDERDEQRMLEHAIRLVRP